MLTISEPELDSVVSSGGSINLTFFGISFGALVAFAITLATVKIDDPTNHAMMVALTWTSGLLSAYFAARSAVDHRRSKQKIRALKSGSISPLP